MGVPLRKALILGAVMNALIAGLIGAVILGATLGSRAGWPGWMTLAAVSILWGAYHGWRDLKTMAGGVLNSLPLTMSYAKIARSTHFGGVAINWQQLDDYAAQLEAQGFTHLGDYTNWPTGKGMVGVAAMYLSRSTRILVEIQYIVPSGPAELVNGNAPNGVHFSILSMLGGQIRVLTTDHVMSGANFVLRSASDVLASHPGENLMALLDLHRRLSLAVAERTGKQPLPGLGVERHVLLTRERFHWVKQRLGSLGYWALISEIDHFNAHPASQWAQPAALLAALPDRPYEELEQNPQLNQVPLIVDLRTEMAAANPSPPGANQPPTASGNAPMPDEQMPDEQELAQFRSTVTALLTRSVSRHAAWFYWIAAMTVINLVAQANASPFHFSLGLGLVSTLFGKAEKMLILGASGGAVLVMYLGCLLAIGLMIACGRFAKKPSAYVFSVGMGFYALDAVVFMLAGDTVGVIIHALALFFLYRGARAARALRVLLAQQAG